MGGCQAPNICNYKSGLYPVSLHQSVLNYDFGAVAKQNRVEIIPEVRM